LKYYENNQKLQSPFPAFIPAAYLYNKKVGDIINFLAYGYPVKLICIDNFEKNFNDKIKGIKENANYTTIFNEFPCPKNGTQNYLITHGILNAINYKKHGPNGYNFTPNNVAQDILRHKKYN